MKKNLLRSTIRIVIFANDSPERWWRLDMPSKWLKKRTNIRLKICNLENWLHYIDQADFVIGRSFISPSVVRFLHRIGKKIFYEIDGAEPFYKKEYHKALKISLPSEHDNNLLKTISTSDGVLVSTEPLRQWIREFFKGRILVFPNLMDFEWWNKKPIRIVKKLQGEIRIGWFGMVSHRFDIQKILVPIIKVFSEEKNIMFYLPESMKPAIPISLMNKIFFFPAWRMSERPKLARTLGIDIMLVPLEKNKFNSFKSPIKYFENAADKIPGIYSPVPYHSYVSNKKTGIIASRTDEWIEAIQQLIQNRALYESIAEQAWKDVYLHYNAAREYTRWSHALETLIK